MSLFSNSLRDSVVHRWLVRRDGPLTRQLRREPSALGLGQVPARLQAEATTAMVCGFCSTGCSLRVLLNQGQAQALLPDREYPVNTGMACPKGWEALAPLSGKPRGTTPLIRRDGKLTASTWEEAILLMRDRFRSIQLRHGNDAVAWLGTGQLPTEELAFLGALGKFGMRMLHGDGNTRQCMATAAVAYKQSFGFDAPPFTYQDLEESDVIVLWGSNLCIAHPILWQRITQNRHHPTIIVVDPRKTETAAAATLHFALEPKSDLVLLYTLANLLISEGWIDRSFIEAHTNGFDEFAKEIADYSVERAHEKTGLSSEQIRDFASSIHNGKRVSFWWTMGVNQSHEGVRTAQAIIALALITGNIGRPGTGANSITGQCNAMGSRIFSNTTNLLGGRDFSNAVDRTRVAQVLGLDIERIPTQGSYAYDQIIEAILAGKIRGLWVIGTNPAHSWINQAHLKDVFDRLELLVVQDMYHDTETAERADIYLPAAGWAEKEGTFINSERRIGLIKKVRRAPGLALADFHIFQLVAEAWGVGELFRKWSTPEAVFGILRELSEGQPCDFTSIEDYGAIDRAGGIQWPARSGDDTDANQRRLFEDGRFYTPDGRARFFYSPPRPLPEPVSAKFPLLLLTGRGSSSQWHTQTRTKHSSILRGLAPTELYVELSATDARALAIKPEQLVMVESQRASIVARAVVSHCVAPGQVFMPMHFASLNRLTFAAFDPHSRQPAYKACAVRISTIVDAQHAPL
jgi:assimilatory nitrate reductase catalytic subunit